jgi:hypothetical protein
MVMDSFLLGTVGSIVPCEFMTMIERERVIEQIVDLHLRYSPAAAAWHHAGAVARLCLALPMATLKITRTKGNNDSKIRLTSLISQNYP